MRDRQLSTRLCEVELDFGHKGYDFLRKHYGAKVLLKDTNCLYEGLLSYVTRNLPGKLTGIRESAIDFQVKYILLPMVSEYLKEGKVPRALKLVIWEATPVLKSLAKKAGTHVKRAERYWEETKKDYLRRTGKKESELTDKDWRYITGVVKKRLGLPVKKVRG